MDSARSKKDSRLRLEILYCIIIAKFIKNENPFFSIRVTDIQLIFAFEVKHALLSEF